ncbi:MAG: hypothetical protein R3304_12990, partial [Longimicrobiales bacterium]|nr:hypothetical protein [Longimicrobiales bacterium]
MTDPQSLAFRTTSPKAAFLLMAAALATPATGVAGQAALVEPLGTHQETLSWSDDSYAEVSLTDAFPSGVLFGGTVYTSMYISTNGYVTFGHPNASYDPDGIAGYTQGPIIAAQFDDWDPSRGGDIYYAQSAGGSGRDAYALVTWQNGLPYTGPVVGSGTNTVQILLRRVGDGSSQDFQIELRYVDLGWSGGAPGGSAYSTAGWSFGDQQTYSELPHSGLSTFLETESESNVGTTGVYRWDVGGGEVASTPTVTSTTGASSVTGSTAETGGSISNSGGSPVTDRGVVYATTST